MLCRGLKTLDKLNAAKAAERVAAEEAAKAAPPLSVSNLSGNAPSLRFAPLSSLSPSFQEFLVSKADVYGAKTLVTLGN